MITRITPVDLHPSVIIQSPWRCPGPLSRDHGRVMMLGLCLARRQMYFRHGALMHTRCGATQMETINWWIVVALKESAFVLLLWVLIKFPVFRFRFEPSLTSVFSRALSSVKLCLLLNKQWACSLTLEWAHRWFPHAHTDHEESWQPHSWSTM